MESSHSKISNEQQQSWDTFSRGWKKWDDVVMAWLRPVGEALIESAQLHDSAHVLDVAAGTGEPGLSAATHVPGGTVTVTDLSEQMLAVALLHAKQRGITNLETKQCDAMALPFEDNRFDAITCRFGIMFFPDMLGGLNEMVRVAKPGAKISLAIWGTRQTNPWATTIMSAIASRVDMPAPSPALPGLFRCATPGMMTGLFVDAGLKNIVERDITGELALQSPEEYWTMLTEVAAPVADGLARADAETYDAIKRIVIDRARQTSDDGRARFHWSAPVITGEK